MQYYDNYSNGALHQSTYFGEKKLFSVKETSLLLLSALLNGAMHQAGRQEKKPVHLK